MSHTSESKGLRILRPIIMFIIGVLFCFSTTLAEKTLSVLLGVGLILAGTGAVLFTFFEKKSLISITGLLGSAFIGLGIVSIIQNVALLIITVVPWILIALGGLAILDSILLLIWRKEDNRVLFILEMLIGATFLALGICLKVITGFATFAGIIFGISLIVCAVYVTAVEILNVKDTPKKHKPKKDEKVVEATDVTDLDVVKK